MAPRPFRLSRLPTSVLPIWQFPKSPSKRWPCFRTRLLILQRVPRRALSIREALPLSPAVSARRARPGKVQPDTLTLRRPLRLSLLSGKWMGISGRGIPGLIRRGVPRRAWSKRTAVAFSPAGSGRRVWRGRVQPGTLNLRRTLRLSFLSGRCMGRSGRGIPGLILQSMPRRALAKRRALSFSPMRSGRRVRPGNLPSCILEFRPPRLSRLPTMKGMCPAGMPRRQRDRVGRPSGWTAFWPAMRRIIRGGT